MLHKVGGLQCSTVEHTLTDGHDDDDDDDNTDDRTLKFSAISIWRWTAVKDTFLRMRILRKLVIIIIKFQN